ncbi:MAG: BolA family protein [Hyphomicrobiaceae bacterium]
MSVESRIREKLAEAMPDAAITIENESHLHHGHHGSPQTGESHFRLHIVSESFVGKSRIERHRIVNEILAAELAGPVHALALRAKAPGEA